MVDSVKLSFIFSEIYHNNLNRFSEAKPDWRKVKAHGELFVKKYANLFPRILDKIQKVTGRLYAGEIKVYIVEWKGPSFSNPLTLKTWRDTDLMLVTLTHELLHIIFKEEGPSPELEKKINNLVSQIFEELGINYKDQIEIMTKFSADKHVRPAKT